MAIKLRAYNPVDVDLGEANYESIDLPYESSKKFQTIMEQMETIDDSEAGEQKAVDLLLEGFDLLLKAKEGTEAAASEVLRKGLDDGAITPRQFLALWTDVTEAIQEANGTEEVAGDIDRPT